MKPFKQVIDKFYGGIVRDDKSKVIGGAVNMEEIDIFTNANFFQAEQVFSADTMPLNVEIYARSIGDDDTAYGIGKNTSSGKAVIVSVASGSATNPGSFTTLFTSTDTVNLPPVVTDLTFFRTTEASNNTYLLYVKGTGTTWNWYKFNIGTATETSLGALTNLNGTNMRPTQKVIFGDCYVCNGNKIDKFDHNAVTTVGGTAAFTLNSEWEAIDIEAVGDAAIIYCRNKAVATNESRGFWWDLGSITNFEDVFPIPMGGPMWIKNIKESVIMFNAINGIGKFYRLSFASKGAIPLEIPGVQLTNIATDASLAPISMAKMVSTKDKILYFSLYKTDKTGIYALGQLDADKPYAIVLAKRYATTDYSLHTPYSLKIQGPNYYADFLDNATKKSVRCSTLNSPSRSSNAVYQSVWLDGDAEDQQASYKDKQLERIMVATYPLPASTNVTVAVATDYGSTFNNAIKAGGGTNIGANDRLGNMRPNLTANNNLVYSVKLSLTSSAANSPKVVSLGIFGQMQEQLADK